MFKQLLKKFMGFGGKKGSGQGRASQPQEKRPLSANIDKNLQALRETFDLCGDVIFREFKLNAEPPIRAFVTYVGTLCDEERAGEHVMKALMHETTALPANVRLTQGSALEIVQNRLVTLTELNTSSDLLEVTKHMVNGKLALVIDGSATAIIAGVPGWENRAIEEPDSEPSVRGPRDGFVENLTTNLATIRRRVKTSRLKVENIEVGVLSKQTVSVLYIKGIASDKIVAEVKERIKRIKVDNIIDSGLLQEFIMDEEITVFPLIQTTERPDKTAASLLEGRVALIVDTTPMTLLVPATFITFLQAAEDSYNEAFYATFIRLLRFVALNIALLLPALYIAITTYHQEMLPAKLLNSIAEARSGVPFPAFVEAILMELTFELLREAGTRLPKNVGQAVSTVGGLVIGQAAVQAGVVSSAMVVVVALTAVASFTIPNISASFSIRILRFSLMILAAIMGAPGIMLGLMFILFHLCGLRSFGVPYLSPFAPLSPSDLKDTFIRVPWWAMITRPRLFGAKEPVRQETDNGPVKPGEGGGSS